MNVLSINYFVIFYLFGNEGQIVHCERRVALICSSICRAFSIAMIGGLHVSILMRIAAVPPVVVVVVVIVAINVHYSGMRRSPVIFSTMGQRYPQEKLLITCKLLWRVSTIDGTCDRLFGSSPFHKKIINLSTGLQLCISPLNGKQCTEVTCRRHGDRTVPAHLPDPSD